MACIVIDFMRSFIPIWIDIGEMGYVARFIEAVVFQHLIYYLLGETYHDKKLPKDWVVIK